jgi:pimeloyl-ACP methyl ester carboxylesterase
VLAPAYPGLEVEALREDPSSIEALTVPAVVEHYERIIGELETPPILMGHSMGGLLVQILLDHGYGAAGVAIDSAPAEGVRRITLPQIKSGFPMLSNPANRHRYVAFTPEQFHYALANTPSREESDKVYERYHIPAPGGFIWGAVLANFTPTTRKTTSTSTTTTAPGCCSSQEARTASCPHQSTTQTPSTTATPRRSLTTRSSQSVRTTR